MKKYGLNIRVQPSQNKQAIRPPLRPPPVGFRDDDDDDDDNIEREISRHAMKNKSLKDIEQQHKKALEEDPSVFDYDGVFDEMKEDIVRPRVQDRQERKPKYIQKLIDKAKEREREQEVIYERNLAKERSKEDHLFADKDKYVTGAYKRKLAEQAKWLQEDRLRQLKEDKEDVTKKSDLSDFYYNLSKNVAFGAEGKKSKVVEKNEEKVTNPSEEAAPLIKHPHDSSKAKEALPNEASSSKSLESLPEKPLAHTSTQDSPLKDAPVQEKGSSEQPATNEPKIVHHKRNEDALAAAKERFLARKKAREQ